MSDVKQEKEPKIYCSESELQRYIEIDVKQVTKNLVIYLPYKGVLLVGEKQEYYEGLVAVEKYQIHEESEYDVRVAVAQVKVKDVEKRKAFNIRDSYLVSGTNYTHALEDFSYDLQAFKNCCSKMGVPLKDITIATSNKDDIYTQPLKNEIARLKQRVQDLESSKVLSADDEGILNQIKSPHFPSKLRLVLDAHKEFGSEKQVPELINSAVEEWIVKRSSKLGIFTDSPSSENFGKAISVKEAKAIVKLIKPDKPSK